jgi:hypothetical protein
VPVKFAKPTTATADGVLVGVEGTFYFDLNFPDEAVLLPQDVQDAIDQAQGAVAGVTGSQAALQRAQIDAQANAARHSGYNSCSTCAQFDVLEALPDGLTTYARGTGFTVAGP